MDALEDIGEETLRREAVDAVRSVRIYSEDRGEEITLGQLDARKYYDFYLSGRDNSSPYPRIRASRDTAYEALLELMCVLGVGREDLDDLHISVKECRRGGIRSA